MPSCLGNWEKESESADFSVNVEEIVFADQQDSCDAELPRSVRMFTPYAIHCDVQLSMDSNIFSLDCFLK